MSLYQNYINKNIKTKEIVSKKIYIIIDYSLYILSVPFFLGGFRPVANNIHQVLLIKNRAKHTNQFLIY